MVFWCDPMPKLRNDQGICCAEKMHRLFLLTLEYAESKLCWDNAFRKSLVIGKHLIFFLNTFSFENFSCVYGVTLPRVVISSVVLRYK